MLHWMPWQSSRALLQAGVPLHAVHRTLRHRDPRMTVSVYGHQSTDHLRAELDRLRFNPETESTEGEAARRVPLMSQP